MVPSSLPTRQVVAVVHSTAVSVANPSRPMTGQRYPVYSWTTPTASTATHRLAAAHAPPRSRTTSPATSTATHLVVPGAHETAVSGTESMATGPVHVDPS